MDIAEQIRQTAIAAAGDISGYPDIETVHRISQPLSTLQSALAEISPDIETDLGELSVRELYQKYFNIAIAVGERDQPAIN